MIKILVVDDEADVCSFVKDFFEARGVRVFKAVSGSEALKVLEKEKVHIILLDVRMKKMDGIETLKKIRETNKAAKVVMVTAVNDQSKMEAARKLGAEKYITKPLVLGELESTVMACVKRCEKNG